MGCRLGRSSATAEFLLCRTGSWANLDRHRIVSKQLPGFSYRYINSPIYNIPTILSPPTNHNPPQMRAILFLCRIHNLVHAHICASAHLQMMQYLQYSSFLNSPNSRPGKAVTLKRTKSHMY